MRYLKYIMFLVIAASFGCNNLESNNKKETTTRSAEGINSLPSGKLTGGVWICDSQLSKLYAENNISITIGVKFTGSEGKGSVEVYEGTRLRKSCVCNGIYTLDSGRKFLQISGINNDNCPWLSKLNGSYVYSKDDRMLYFVSGSIRMFTSK